MSPIIGRRSRPRATLVTRQAVRDFARAVADPRPICVDVLVAQTAGHPDLLAPPTFPTTFSFPLPEIEGLDWQSAAWVHGEQEYSLGAAIHAGDTVTVVAEVESWRERHGGERDTILLTLVERGLNQRGEVTHEGRGVILGYRQPAKE